ncbi:MAG: hypothetical protein ABI986_10515, partial [Chloroflexota bacterium]
RITRDNCGKISPAMMEPEELPEFDAPQVTRISQAEVHNVRADLVQMHQADAENIIAQEVNLQQSAAANVKADRFSAHQSAIGMLNAKDVSSEDGAVGLVQAEKMSAGGYTGIVLAGSAEIQHSLVGFVVGRDVHVEESSRTGILLARNVSGSVTALLDTRGALIMGLVSGLFAGLMLLLGRSLFGRK